MSTEAGFAQPATLDELETEILPLRRRRRLPLVTALLGVAVMAGGAFAGGVEIQKHYGSSGTAGSSSGLGGSNSFAAARRSARGGGGGGSAKPGAVFFGPGGASAGDVTAGLVTLIRGKTLYVTDFNGNTVKVSTSRARITKTATANLRSIHPGDSVVVRGTTKKGTVAASSISLGAANGLGGG